jgi:hypothetical protein
VLAIFMHLNVHCGVCALAVTGSGPLVEPAPDADPGR